MQYTKNDLQAIPAGGTFVFDPSLGCRCAKGSGVTHRPGSGIFTLAAGRTYRVDFKANIALPTGATVGPIAAALAIDGEVVPVTRAIVTPAAEGDFWEVSFAYEVSVPCSCCQNVSVENVLPDADPATVAVPVEAQNAIIIIDPVAR